MSRFGRVEKGRWAENLAYRYLCEQHLHPVTRNHRYRGGEIDIIMQQDNTLIFVEVRYRVDQRYGSSAESVNLQKQQRIIETAQHFLQKYPHYQHSICRFDAVLITGKASSPQVQWLQDAFRG